MIYIVLLLIVFLIFGFVVFIGSPYVPSQRKYLKLALTKLYKVSSNDCLVDIGSGDGIVLRMAAKYGARAVGFEVNPILVLLSRLLSKKNKKVQIIRTNFWCTQLPDDTTVVYIFSVPRDMKHMFEKIQKDVNRIGRPLNVISYASEFLHIKPIKSISPYHLYLIKPVKTNS